MTEKQPVIRRTILTAGGLGVLGAALPTGAGAASAAAREKQAEI